MADRATATVRTARGIYSARLHPDGSVSIWLDRVSFVGEGRWTGSTIDLWSKLLEESVRAELSRRLAALLNDAWCRLPGRS